MSSDEGGAGVRQRLIRMDGDSRRWGNVDGLLNLCDGDVSERELSAGKCNVLLRDSSWKASTSAMTFSYSCAVR